MTTNPRKITDYAAVGTHAARPATPNTAAGEISFYYETDTSHLFCYIIGTGWVQTDNAPSIVQQKAVVNAGSAVMGSGPVLGNLLIALTADPGTSENPGSGWTRLAFNSAVNDGVGIFWKLAGASESTTQTPTTATPAGMVIFEVANASPGAFTQNPDLSGTAIAASTTSTKKSGSGLVLGMACNRSASVAPTSITGATLLGSAVQGSSRTVQPFRVTTPTNGTNTVTANYASSQGAVIPMIDVG